MGRGRKSNGSMGEKDFSTSGGGINDFEDEMGEIDEMELGDEGF